MNHAYKDYPAWHNGVFCTVQDLDVSILDLGLIHSDATYDVMAFINNRGLKIQEHVDRFLKSCEHWRINAGYTQQQFIDIAVQLHSRTGWDSSIIWMSVTRGIPESGNPRDLKNCKPNLMLYAKPYQKFNGTNQATVCLSKQLRVPDCAIDQAHKNFVWCDLTRAQWESIDRGYDTALLLSVDGFLTEGPGFNVAIVQDGTVRAPRTNRLPGISMLLVKETCEANDIKFIWDDIDQNQLHNCDDMFLTTTVGNIVTVTNFDGRNLSPSAVQKLLIKKINQGQ